MNYKLKLRFEDFTLWQQLLVALSTFAPLNSIEYMDFYNLTSLNERLRRKSVALYFTRKNGKSYGFTFSPNEFFTWEKLLTLNEAFIQAHGNESVPVLINEIKMQVNKQEINFNPQTL